MKANYFLKIVIAVLFTLICKYDLYNQNIDINILKDINLNRNRSLDPTFQFFSNSAAPGALAAPVIVYSIGFFSKDKDIKDKAIVMGESILVSTISTFAIKYLVDRDRPFVSYPFIEKGSDAGSPSFPSGHTSVSFATATSLSLAFPKWYVIVPSYLWAGTVAYSRMHLGVHYPSDVAAGAVLGTVSSYLTYKVNKRLQFEKRKNLESTETPNVGGQ